ncbi:import inner membrane translocase subunit tim-50 [Lentinula aciculospora]|uniref:Mitochondrial import inner membrane translocase subunit TIM50 n=1 Tax=Lentinula aciculospora TaxID=153920 RepID=A0A9W9A0C4_9AGAR|nr:import inner membrane translocase subunit tim-50 [Lentinula aciculospora]
MLSVVSRSVSRRVLVQSTRCMAQKVPKSPNFNSSSSPPTSSSTPNIDSKETESPLTSEQIKEPVLTRSSVPSLDFSPLDPTEQRTGASSRDSLSSADRQRRMYARIAFGLFTLGIGLNVAFMGREWEPEELEAKKMTLENAPAGRWERTKNRYSEMFSYFSDPVMTELLPPRTAAQYPPSLKPYTLLVSVDDLLVTSTWDRQHGWRTAKRPGVDYFLAYISQFYEVVVFTTQYSYTAMPILDKLDRYNFYIEHRLFREHTRSHNGEVVKDLSYLNRDLSKVILLDTHPEHAATHPENSVIIPGWKGDPKDNGLVAMIPFLESIAIYKPTDVRPILTAYHGKNIPLEYAKREAEGKQKHIENWKHNTGTTSNSFGGFLGVSSRSTQNAPPTYLEQKRKEAQQQYLEEQAHIAKNKDYLESLLKHEQDVMAAQAPNNIWEMIDTMRGNPKVLDESNIPPPPPPPPGMGFVMPPPQPPATATTIAPTPATSQTPTPTKSS